MKTIFSVIIWAIYIMLTILLFFVVLFVMFAFPFDKKRSIAHAQCFWWADAIARTNPLVSYSISGLENIDQKRTYIIVANHQSVADIIILYKTRIQFKWVAKESLFYIPFLGWCLFLIKHIKLSRNKQGSIRKVYREAIGWLKDGVSVLFFPEGTRSQTNLMNKFQDGAFKLAIKERKPILPILISGTGKILPKGERVFKQKVFCKLTVLPAIETEEFRRGESDRLMDIVRKKLESAGA